jgi:hypothetical protein
MRSLAGSLVQRRCVAKHRTDTVSRGDPLVGA